MNLTITAIIIATLLAISGKVANDNVQPNSGPWPCYPAPACPGSK